MSTEITGFKNQSCRVPQESSIQLMNEESIVSEFKMQPYYVFAGRMNDPLLFAKKIIARYQPIKFKGRGTTKTVFENCNGNVVKIVFCTALNYPLNFCIQELYFLLFNPNISNQPKEITIYLSNVDKSSFLLRHADLINRFSIKIEIIDEPRFEGVITWEAESYELSATDVLKNFENKILFSDHMRLIANFWKQMKSAIEEGKQYMVTDLGTVNVAIFRDRSVRLIDAQPSETPLALQEVITNIEFFEIHST